MINYCIESRLYKYIIALWGNKKHKSLIHIIGKKMFPQLLTSLVISGFNSYSKDTQASNHMNFIGLLASTHMPINIRYMF